MRKALLTVLMIAVLLFGMCGMALASSAQPLAGALAASVARSLADGAQTATSRAVRSAEPLQNGRLRLLTPRPVVVAEAEVASLPAQVYNRAIDILMPNIRNLTGDQARAVVQAGCMFKDAAQAVSEDSLAEQLTSAGVSFGGNSTLRLRARELINDMKEAQSVGGAVGYLAVAYICEQR